MTLLDLARFGGPHHQALEVLSARALESGDVAAAYRLSDRRCRIRPYPESHCFVLRAEALQRMGERAAAMDDLVAAIQIAPDDLAANRRLLAWGRGRQQIAAAKVLLDRERDMRVVRQAIAVLRKHGDSGFASVQVREHVIEGWAAWSGDGPVSVAVADGADCVETLVESDPRHPLAAELGNAVSFVLPRPAARGAQLITVMRDRAILVSLRAADSTCAAVSAVPSVSATGSDLEVTVIVPVYADHRATRACLDSLVSQLDGGGHRAILVNDASPDPRMADLLDVMARRINAQVLTNPGNLGFVGAINRALQEVPTGDVVLLNADTIVPAGFIDRLAAAARSSPDVGTVTPLSNNGEFTSFPLPNQSNPAGAAADVERLDRIAAAVNAGAVVDIPNGIGFCLYVTRACLDVVGGLSESYHRGYLEDVDFCLRARQRGFRNVCATSVYVGHAGSRSFGKQKRSLVVRNLEVVERRFPAYRAECADFILADPLKAARQAIEVRVPPRPHATLLVSAGGAVAEVARERARRLLSGDVPAVLLLEICRRPGRIIASLCDAAGAAPQSLEFELPASAPVSELLQFLRRSQLARIELLDLARIPRALVNTLLQLQVPYDIFIAHAELGREPGCVATRYPAGHSTAGADRIAPDAFFWRGAVARADRVIVPDAQAEAVAASLALRRHTVRSDAGAAKPAGSSRRAPGPATRLGLVPVRAHAQDGRFLRDLIIGLRRVLPNLDIVVAGATGVESDLLRQGAAFVTGPVDAAEFEELFRRYQFDRLFPCLTQPLFGHPVLSGVMSSALPVAYLDWSRGRCRVRDGDLSLDPQPAAAVVERLVPWLQGQHPA